MKKPILHIMLWSAVLILFMFILRTQNKIAYENGRKSITCSCSLEDICTGGYQEAGFLSDYEKGVKFQFYKCAVYAGQARVEDDFIFEGDWEKCDSNGENCVPVQQN
jgi:hypothetical protein